MNRQKIYLAIVLALIFMSSCGSSAKLAKNHDEMKSDPSILLPSFRQGLTFV